MKYTTYKYLKCVKVKRGALESVLDIFKAQGSCDFSVKPKGKFWIVTATKYAAA